jgi:hypothetical protein
VRPCKDAFRWSSHFSLRGLGENAATDRLISTDPCGVAYRRFIFKRGRGDGFVV